MKSGKFVLAFKTETPDLPSKINRTAAVVKNRCFRFGIRCQIQTQDKDYPNRVSINFSSVMDLDRVRSLLLGEGFQVRAVNSEPFPAELSRYETRAEALKAAGEKEVFPLPESGNETFIVVDGPPVLTGDDLRDCAIFNVRRTRTYRIHCFLRPKGAVRLEAFTRANISRFMTVLFNGKAMSVAYIMAPISLDMEVSGIVGRQQAREIANIFESGNLPARFDIVHEEITP